MITLRWQHIALIAMISFFLGTLPMVIFNANNGPYRDYSIAPIVKPRIDNVKDNNITEISLERTPCFGTCPVYKIILKKDKSAILINKLYTNRLGTYKAEFYQFDKLASAISYLDYFTLKNSYSNPAVDLQYVLTSVVYNGHRKNVDDYALETPLRLWIIEQLIDNVISYTKWTKVSDKTEYPK